MFRLAAIALLLLAQTGFASAATCSGADPAILSVAVKSVTRDGSLDKYLLVGRVENLGASAQASKTMQFVDIYKNRVKLDSRGIPPLKPGQSYSFSYTSARSHQAGKNTTLLAFMLDMRATAAGQDCDASNDRVLLRF